MTASAASSAAVTGVWSGLETRRQRGRRDRQDGGGRRARPIRSARRRGRRRPPRGSGIFASPAAPSRLGRPVPHRCITAPCRKSRPKSAPHLPAVAEKPFMAVTLESLDLAALLCSRVCHDLISPAGAIVNGLEVLEESKDEETKTFALTLIKKSARTATARLQFCRIAFGAAGSDHGAGRYRRCRAGRARLHRGREGQADLESAARLAAEKPGQASAQHAGGRRARRFRAAAR